MAVTTPHSPPPLFTPFPLLRGGRSPNYDTAADDCMAHEEAVDDAAMVLVGAWPPCSRCAHFLEILMVTKEGKG